MKDYKVNLGAKRRVKINGKRVSVPYTSRQVTVSTTDGWVLVETYVGVKLLWDGDSFLELSAPPKYKVGRPNKQQRLIPQEQMSNSVKQ